MKIAAGTRARCTRGAAHAPVTAQPAMEFVLRGAHYWFGDITATILVAVVCHLTDSWLFCSRDENTRERLLKLHTTLTTYGSIVTTTPLWKHTLSHQHRYPHVTPIFTGKTNAVRKCFGRGWNQRRLPGDAFRVGSARASCKYGVDARRPSVSMPTLPLCAASDVTAHGPTGTTGIPTSWKKGRELLQNPHP